MKIGEKNMGKADIAVRAVLAIALLAASLAGFLSPPISYLAIALGFVMIITAAYGTCPLYSIIGLNTCNLFSDKKDKN